MGNFRQLSVLAIALSSIIGTAGTLAAAFGLRRLTMAIAFIALFLLTLLVSIGMRHVLEKAETAHIEARANGAKNKELISAISVRLDETISRITTEQAEGRGALSAQHEEIVGVQKKLATLDGKIVTNRNALDSVQKEIKNGVREAERRMTKNVPKALEVRRAHERVEAAERRILGVLETQLYAQGSTLSDQSRLLSNFNDRLESVSAVSFAEALGDEEQDRLPGDSKLLESVISKINRHVTATIRDSTRQVESLVQLMPRFSEMKLPMPNTGGFAIDAQALAHLVTIVEERRPRQILELGSGTSSIWLGYLCRSFGGRLVTLDHLEEYLELTRSAIERHHLNDHVDSRLAPLEKLVIKGDTYDWYSAQALEGLSEIDLIVIDGPPAATGPSARYPALPMLVDLLSSEATIVLDDAHRDDEVDILQGWQEAYPDLIRVETGTSRLAILERSV